MEICRKEHPKPQFERSTWQNLNGPWQFEIDFGSSNKGDYHKPETRLSRTINVPFCPESDLSGIGYKDFMNTVWYKRTITVTEAQLAGRVLLHFGAVDYHARVYLNGEQAGEHKGGYVSFSLDVTKYLKPGDNDLTVRADDFFRDAHQPSGKQCPDYHSRGCHYTRTTGIWQTVWLEFVPKVYLSRVKVDTDFRTGQVNFQSEIAGGDPAGLTLRASISFAGAPVAEVQTPAATHNHFSACIADAKLWDVEQPNLYDVTYALVAADGSVCDTVRSYFGIRGIEVKNGAMYLNGRPVFQRLALDQGFYPDGIYTAPSDDALRRDIELSLAVGFNGARLHQKVFEERFLYWADKLGYLVWGEHACWGLDYSDLGNIANFLPEWLEIVARDYNHPAIIGWCPFNETWDFCGRPQNNELLRLTYLATKAADQTRPVIDTSGNFHVVTDIYDTHDYDQDINVVREHYKDTKVGETLYDFHGRHGRQRYEGQPIFISEYGGTWWAPGADGGWGYGNAPKTEAEACERICALTEYFLDNENICAVCYTQLTDVEQEQNGMYTYAREPKFSKETYAKIRAALRKQAAIEKK